MVLRFLTFSIFMVISFAGMTQSNLISTEQFFQGDPQTRSTFQYDDLGREVGSKHYSITSSGSWGLHTSEEKRFDQAGRQIFYSRSGWKYAYDSLYFYYEVQSSYNDAGKIANENTTSIYNASGSNEQKLQTGKIYQYNDSGCLSKVVHKTFFEGGGAYESIEQYESDSQCRPLIRTHEGDITIWTYETNDSYVERRYYINENDSVLVDQVAYTNNLITEQIYPQKERKTYAYNADGKITEQGRFTWQESVWVLNELTINTYDESNMLIKAEILSGPDVVTQPLFYESITTYKYNEFGSVKYMESNWIDYQFNGTYSQSSFVNISFRCDGKPLTWISTEKETNKENMKIIYYYSSAAPCEPTASQVSLFPNPTTRFLKINTPEPLENAVLKFYNTNGQLLSEILDTKHMSPIEIDLEYLIPGFYILKIESNGKVFGERFVKK